MPKADARDDATSHHHVPWAAIGVSLAVAAATIAIVLAIEPLRQAASDAVSGDTASLRSDLRGLGAGGVAILFALAMLHTFVWYPAEIVDAAAGFVYGFWVAFPLLMVFWTLQAIVAHEIGRRAARPLLHRFIRRERFERVERAIDNGGATLLLAARLVPVVPFSLFSYVAGAAGVPIRRFAWTTFLGYLPITALSVYFGTRLEDLSLSDPLIWVTLVALLALLMLAHFLRPMVEGTRSAREDA